MKGGGKGLVSGKRDMDDMIKATDHENLDLIPADFRFRNLDLLLEAEKKSTRRLRKLLKPLGSDYDIILLDCPPSVSLVSEAVFEAADALVIPLIPTTLSLRTYDQLEAFKAEQKIKDLKLLPFFSMVDRRKALHREILESLDDEIRSLREAVETERKNYEGAQRNVFDRHEGLQQQVISDRRISAITNIRQIRKETQSKIRSDEGKWQNDAARWLGTGRRKVELKQREDADVAAAKRRRGQ